MHEAVCLLQCDLDKWTGCQWDLVLGNYFKGIALIS